MLGSRFADCLPIVGVLLGLVVVVRCQEQTVVETTVEPADDVACDRVPPSLWCSCDKLADKCGFSDKCKQFRSANWNKPVLLTLFYESLCPGCAAFITKTLSQAVKMYDQKYLQIELVPYGNAKRTANSTVFKCQHGEEECKGNKYESCVIRFLEKPLPFIICLEQQLPSGTNLEKAAERCHRSLNISHIEYDQIIHCFHGSRGDMLQQQAADRTDQAWPDQHEWVPWVLFNNVSLQNRQYAQASIQDIVCDMYVGDKSPPGCGIDSAMKSHRKKGKLVGHKMKKVCPRDW